MSKTNSPSAFLAHPASPVRLLSDIGEAIEEQRAAVLSRDSVALERLSERLARLLPHLAGLNDRVSPMPSAGTDEAAQCAAVSLKLREQILVNQTLLRNGLAITDHFMLAVEQASDGTDGTGSRLQVTA
jgi:hypothetical protein